MSGRTLNLSVPPPIFIDTEDQARWLLHRCLRKIKEDPQGLIGFDTETHGKKLPFTIGNRYPLDWMSDTVTFWSLAFELRGEVDRYCIRSEYFQYFAPVLEHPDAWFACWNAKYDAHVSWNMGVNVWNANIVDGLALCNLHDENLLDKGLKARSAKFCGLPMTKFGDLFPKTDEQGNKVKEFSTSLYDLPLALVVDYASYDAFCHLKTVEWLINKLKRTPVDTKGYSMWEYYLSLDKKFTEILWRMERRGMFVDQEHLKQALAPIDQEMAAISRDVNRAAGRDVNINAPKQLATLFFGSPAEGGLGLKPLKTTKGGSISVDKEVLELLSEMDIELATLVNRYRKLVKFKSTYLTQLYNLASYYDDSRIHPNLHQFGAKTGRISADAPNSMNMPRAGNDEWGVRRAFVAPPGYKLIVGDFEQLEMRIMAHMSQDDSMLRAIQEGKDLHSFTVSRMVPGVSYEDVVAAKKSDNPTGKEKHLVALRQDNKAVGFGIIYGAGAPSISQRIDISDEEVNARISRMERQELIATDQEKRRGRTLSARIKRAIKNNPLLTRETARIKVARESIAQDKIEAYLETFPKVKIYMNSIPEECRMSAEVDFFGKPRYRPEGRTVEEDDTEYDWDMDVWDPGADMLTRTGHSGPFGFVQTLLGRYRRLPDILSKNRMRRAEAERQAVNTTIQGSAADLIKAAMCRIEATERLSWMGVRMLNQVHDELVFEVPEEYAEEALPIIVECMEHPFEEGRDPLHVPTPVDAKIVDSWDQAK